MSYRQQQAPLLRWLEEITERDIQKLEAQIPKLNRLQQILSEEKEMKFSQMKAPSKYLSKEDIDPKKLVTIRKFAMETIEGRGKSEDKWILYFNEFEKGMVLNPTNQKLMMLALGLTPDTDTTEAIGKKIIVWNDMSVQDLNGELVGGIRIRKYNPSPAQQAVKPEPLPPAADEFEDDIPF